jgi:cobalt-zinc-cadmium efflux system protein
MLIAYSSLKLVREAFHGLMEGVPLHLSLEEIGLSMATVEGVTSVHDLHVWSLTDERIALSAHVVVEPLDDWPATLERLRSLLAQRHGIEHVTLHRDQRQTPCGICAASEYSLTELYSASPAPGRDR